MKKFYGLLFLFAFAAITSCNKGDGYTYAEIKTTHGTMKVKLFNSTPQHRDNFIKLANEGFYEDLLFHRVIKGFMAQGGDPESRGAAPGKRLGSGGPGYTIPAEIGAPHIKGALSAARTGGSSNPEKRSSGSQFYIVSGKPVSDAQLNQFEQSKGIKYSAKQRELYKKLGGAPFLDMDYTVYGEVVEGLEVIDKIESVQTQADRPLEDVKMNIKILK